MKEKKYKIKNQSNIGLFLALMSACLYAFNVIIEKKYIENMSSEKILFLMYLGAGLGLYIINIIASKNRKSDENKITKREIPKVITIAICELIASFLIIEAIKHIDASLVSLLSIFEIVMTSICAYFIFKDPIEKKEIVAMSIIILASLILNFKDNIFNRININSILVIGACLFWGIENNITALISSKEPSLFTSIKCSSVALMYFVLMIIKGSFSINYPILALYGFFSYGLSILFYALSTKYLGASKSTMIFSFSPIFAVLLSIIIYNEKITFTFLISTILMIISIIIINLKSKE